MKAMHNKWNPLNWSWNKIFIRREFKFKFTRIAKKEMYVKKMRKQKSYNLFIIHNSSCFFFNGEFGSKLWSNDISSCMGPWWLLTKVSKPHEKFPHQLLML
jgi:hypothetical protein